MIHASNLIDRFGTEARFEKMGKTKLISKMMYLLFGINKWVVWSPHMPWLVPLWTSSDVRPGQNSNFRFGTNVSAAEIIVNWRRTRQRPKRQVQCALCTDWSATNSNTLEMPNERPKSEEESTESRCFFVLCHFLVCPCRGLFIFVRCLVCSKCIWRWHEPVEIKHTISIVRVNVQKRHVHKVSQLLKHSSVHLLDAYDDVVADDGNDVRQFKIKIRRMASKCIVDDKWVLWIASCCLHRREKELPASCLHA